MRCQRQILGVQWFDFISNDEIAPRTGLLPITDLTHSKTPAFSIFSHRPSVCQRLFQPTKPHAATSMHHSVDHLITHGYVDQAGHATTGWSTSVRTPAFLLQLIYDAGPSSADTERRYGPGCSYAMMMMMMMMMMMRSRQTATQYVGLKPTSLLLVVVAQAKMSSPLSSVNAALKQPSAASRRTDDDDVSDDVMMSRDNNVRSSSSVAAEPSHSVYTGT